jgi:hypothetical protein
VGGRSEVLDRRHVLPFYPYWSADVAIAILQAMPERDNPVQRPFFGQRIG